MRRLLSRLFCGLALLMLILPTAGLAAPLPRASFPDVATDASYAEAIDQLVARGIVRGYPDGRFGPDDSLLRAQAAGTLTRAMGLTGQSSSRNFSDQGATDDELWMAVCLLADRDIARGFPDGTFQPGGVLTRQQAISFVSRMMVALGAWRTQAATMPYGDVAPAHAPDVATYNYYVGTMPQATVSAAGASVMGADSTATRGWYAETLWSAVKQNRGRPGSAPSPTPTPSPLPSPATASAGQRLYGLVGQGGLREPLDSTLLQAQYNAGVRVRLVELGWDFLQPNGPSDWSSANAQVFQQRIDAFVNSGPDVQLILDLGLQYPPSWVTTIDPMVDQYGNSWVAKSSNGGGANLYWSPTVRRDAQIYLQKMFTSLNFHGRLWTVRVGLHGGELLYPRLAHSGASDSFWAFDATAQAQSPVPGWRPGQPSPNGEAQRFYLWYVDNLTNTFTFMLNEIRQYHAGYVAPVTPGAGMWDGLLSRLVKGNLYDSGLGHTGTGNYWQRIYGMLPGANQNVMNWCSSFGDASGVNDSSMSPWDWSAAHQHAYLAQQNGRQIYAENPGRNAYDTTNGADPRTTMAWDFQALQIYNYSGLLWVRQSDMTNPSYASLQQYATAIAQAK
jgi:hypothetical protein